MNRSDAGSDQSEDGLRSKAARFVMVTAVLAPLLAIPGMPGPALADPDKPASQPAKPEAATSTPPPVKEDTPPTAKVEAAGIVGRRVLGPDGAELGRVVDVLIDANSHPRAAVIDFGGFLGVGTRRIAVDWSDMNFPPTGGPGDVTLDLPADKIRNAPAYTDQTKPAAVVEPSATPASPGH